MRPAILFVMSGAGQAPVVSVIIPTYNVAGFVGQAIRSALGQTLREMEVIVADDGSTDGTPEVVRSFSDPRLTLTVFPHRGPTWVLNDSVARARGRYWAMLDGDDVWAAERLRKHVDYMDAHPETDLTFSLSRFIDESGADLGITSRTCKEPPSFRRLFEENLVSNGSAVLIRREAAERAGPFDTALAACYDHDLWLRIALQRPANVHCIPEILTFYRRRSGQITKDWRLMEAMSSLLAEKFRGLRPEDVASGECARRSNLGRYLAAIAFDNADYRTGMRLLWNAMQASPEDFLGNPRSYRVCAALTAGMILPEQLLTRLQRWSAGKTTRVEIPA
jgi:hypothetical protein